MRLLTKILQSKGYTVSEALDGEEFKAKATELSPDLIIANADFWQQSDEVKALRFQKEMENVLFILLSGNTPNGSDHT
ncbi:MAG: response regulator [Leptolyngbya sp. SIOISBB]|nr:response regulator [Leptolyngbya sp. SIOISBB]